MTQIIGDPMNPSFSHAILGQTGISVCRLGLSASYRPGKRAVYRGLDEGLNLFFCYGFDTQMIGVLREIPGARRQQYCVVSGAHNLLWTYLDLQRTLERRLRQLRTEYVDVFLLLGVMKEKQLPPQARDELYRLREKGLTRAVGISTHNRDLAGRLAAGGELDVIMMRYNAAHRGAETDIFPHLDRHNPGVLSYTATRWRQLLRRPRGWPTEGRIPTAGMCYRFVLTNPHVDVCLTAPSNIRQLEENVSSFRKGPLAPEDMVFMESFGNAVRETAGWLTRVR
jgi:aryl-alcohol dehydrogenase-like predicted oxidoreductase